MTYTPGFDVSEPPTLTKAPAPAAPIDLTSGLTADAAGGAITGDGGADAWSKIGQVFATTHAALQYDADTNGKFLATSDAFDVANKQIADASGAQLENPLSGGYTIAARQRYLDANGHAPDLTDPHTQVDFNQYRISAWQDDLARLRADNPAVPTFAQSDIEQLAKDRTNLAVQSAHEAWKNAPAGPASWAAWAAGAGAAMLRDPIMTASTVVGGGELKAASVFGRLIEAGVKEAAQNAAIQSLAEPWVQKWRAERGQDSGFVPALEDVGVAALFGAGAGGARAAFHGAPKPLASPELVGRAISGDLDAAKELAGALPSDVAPTLHAAMTSEDLDRAAMSSSGAPGEADPVLARQAIRHVEDPLNDPLPGFASEEARGQATQAIDAQTVPDQQAAILGTHAPIGRVPEPTNVVDTLPERSRQVEALKRELALPEPEPAAGLPGSELPPEIADTLRTIGHETGIDPDPELAFAPVREAGLRPEEIAPDIGERAMRLVEDGAETDGGDALERAAVETAAHDPVASEALAKVYGDEIRSEAARSDGARTPAEGEGASGGRASTGADGADIRGASEGGALPAEAGRAEPVSADAGGQAAGVNDLLSMVPIADRTDGADMRAVPRDQVLNDRPREELLAHLVNDCSI